MNNLTIEVDKGGATDKAKTLTNNYINLKIASALDRSRKVKPKKKELMIKAGFSEISAEKNNIENTVLYSGETKEILSKTGFIVKSILEVMVKRIESGELEGESLSNLTKELKTFVDINKALLPTFKQKEVKIDSEGNRVQIWKTLN